MLNRRIKGIESKIEQKVAKELRQKVTVELDGLRQSVLTAENKANAAVLAKDNYMERVVKLEEDLALYKTELCRSWEETGSCRYGGKCQFAHGRDELRPVMRHPKYKTEVCRTFAQSGACPYGTRCRFIHYRVPTRSVCGTLIAGAHNVIPTDWSPEMSSNGGARGGFQRRRYT